MNAPKLNPLKQILQRRSSQVLNSK